MTVFPLTLIKLGGSLITDKTRPHTPRLDVLARLADEIASARRVQPGLRLLLGHGSGSFGHVPAQKYGTRQGVHTPAEWLGFVEVWREAAALNHLVMDALAGADVPAIAFSPSAAVIAAGGQAAAWDLSPLSAALEAGLLHEEGEAVRPDHFDSAIHAVYAEIFLQFSRKYPGDRITKEVIFREIKKLVIMKKIKDYFG